MDLFVFVCLFGFGYVVLVFVIYPLVYNLIVFGIYLYDFSLFTIRLN